MQSLCQKRELKINSRRIGGRDFLPLLSPQQGGGRHRITCTQATAIEATWGRSKVAPSPAEESIIVFKDSIQLNLLRVYGRRTGAIAKSGWV